MYVPGSPFPNHQKPDSHMANPIICAIHAFLENLPFSDLLNDQPAAVTIDDSSRKGITTTRKKSSVGTVVLRAHARASGFKEFDISQRINSASTAASAIVVEKHPATILRLVLFVACSECFCFKKLGASLGR